MVQELLNRSSDYLWAIPTNGLRLRLLRDNAYLSRPAYVEFDLEAMFKGEAYSDFALFWLTAHASRVAGTPETCWLERWNQQAQEDGTRALDSLRDGVERALTTLGTGFLQHKQNEALRECLRSGSLSKQTYYRQLLRIVYRLLFLFVAEDRDVLLERGDPAARSRYTSYYSTAVLRELARKRLGSERHGDRWEGLKLVMGALGGHGKMPRLALSALGSYLWSDEAVGLLGKAALSNSALLGAVRDLSLVEQGGIQRVVDFKHLGTEELGGVYESLLDLTPDINLDARSLHLLHTGTDRKTTGSYYTPKALVHSLLDTALTPVLDQAERKADPEAALIGLKVCDPAVGSGHFLVEAGHRIASRLAHVRADKTPDHELTPHLHQEAFYDVMGRCLYGVDLNPDAVDLCRFNLWLEAQTPGKPLSLLEHHLQLGNGLLGATPAALEAGIPEAAFKPITGDEKAYAAEYKKQNRTFRKKRQRDLFAEQAMPWDCLGNLPAVIAELDRLPADSVSDVEAKRKRYAKAVSSTAYEHARLLADAWCAAFVWPKRPSEHLSYPIHEEIYRKIERNPHTTKGWMREEIGRLAERYKFFHWHLAFPDVFRVPASDESATDETTGWKGGFDCVLGNPPWETVELKEKEFFTGKDDDIADARTTSSRKKLIKKLAQEDPSLYAAFQDAQRQAEGERQLLRETNVFPLTARGRVNTYALFAERFTQLTAPDGRAGVIVPTGIATDATTQYFFRDLIETSRLSSLLSFENEEKIFPSVHHAFKFCLLTMSGTDAPDAEADLIFFARQTADLRDRDRRFQLSRDDFARLNPNSKTSPTFRLRRDAELTKAIYRRVPVLIDESRTATEPWDVSFRQGLFNMSSDSDLFQRREKLEMGSYRLDGNVFVDPQGSRTLPLYEGKMFWHFDPRFGTYDGQTQAQANQGKLPEATPESHADPDYVSLPRYWVDEAEVDQRLGDYDRGWLLSFRDITSPVNERTAVFSVLARAAVGHPSPLMFSESAEPSLFGLLHAELSSFVFDYVTRQKLGGTHLTYTYLKQLPVLPPETYRAPCPWAPGQTLADWIRPRVLELTYTAWDLQAFAQDVGYDGPPFVWDEARREKLRAELDAAFFHLYLGTPAEWAAEPQALREPFPTPRDAAAYAMETFPIVKKKDVKAHGSYRTKDLILSVYDRLAEAAASGTPYETLLDPPPAHPAAAHPPRETNA